MATYLPGVTDYIPQIQPFTPDFNAYSGALNFKQSKHDAARKQLSSIYGSLLNAPLTRDDNANTRDKFFKTIEQDIHKMAGMDLSLAANSEAAAGVFNQLLDNKAIVKDMVWTKNFQSQMQRAEGFKNCVDPEKCGGQWWEGGERLLAYNRDAFRNASADQAMNFGNAEFVAAQDVTKKALALAKEADLNVSVDQITGQWITTTKNGPLIIQPLQNLFMGSIAKDPKVMEYYKAQSELQRKDFMYSNKEQYGSLEGAEQAYITQMSQGIDKLFAGTQRALEEQVTTTQQKKAKLEKAANGAVPEKRSRLEQMHGEFNKLEEGYSSTLDVVKGVNGEVDVARNNQKYTGDQIDRILSTYSLGNDIGKIAQTLAYKDYEVSHKANPYGVEAASFRNRMLLEEFKHRNSMELARLKGELKNAGEKIDAGGGAEQNTPEGVEVLGGTTINEQDVNLYENNQRGFKEFSKDRGGLRLDLSRNEKAILGDVIKRTRVAADQGDAQAREDYVALGEAYVSSLSKSQGKVGDPGRGDYKLPDNSEQKAKAVNLKKALSKASTASEKYKIIRNANLDLSAIRGGQVDHMYNSIASDMINPSKSENPVLRDYLAPVWQASKNQRMNISAKQEALKQYDQWYAKEAADVIQGMKSSNKYDTKMIDAMEAYVDLDTGHTRNKTEFIKELTNKGYSKTTAEDLWGADKRKSWNDPNQWGDGTYNVAASIIDGIGTTVAGILGGEFAGYGFEYDSPEDVANWGGYSKKGATTKGNPRHAEWDSQRFAKAGIHDEWKRAFTEFAEPDGNRASLHITGAGDHHAKGQRYSVVDPKAYRSIATMGTVCFLKDALNDPKAIFDMGGFKANTPGSDDKSKQIAQRILSDMMTIQKGEGRPLADVTYADIAGGNGSNVGINIKLTNQSYLNKYKGSKDNPGLFKDYMNQLANEGITIYMDRNKAKNVFTQGSKKSSLENLMDWTGKVDFDQSPYFKDFAIKAVEGGYNATGMIQSGIKEDGTLEWQYYDSFHQAGTDLNSLISKYDDFIATIHSQNAAIEKKYSLEHGR
jgi:hypothetical protein